MFGSGLWKATLSLGVVMLLTRAVNFMTQMVIANQFGATVEADAYFFVENVMLILGSFIITGFSSAYIPLWMEYRAQKGIVSARRLNSSLFSYITAVTIGLAFIGALVITCLRWMPVSFQSVRMFELCKSLFLMMAPVVALLGLTAACTGLLQAHRRFIIPELSYTAYNLVILSAAGLFTRVYGILALGWGVIAAAVVRLALQFGAANKSEHMHLHWRAGTEGVHELNRRLPPIFLAAAGTQITLLIAIAFASRLPEGAISGLVYSSRIILLPIGMFILPFQTTLLPLLANQAASKLGNDLKETTTRGFRITFLLTVPISAAMIFCKDSLVQLFYQRGSFTNDAAALTSGILGWYALALPATAVLMMVNSVYCSLGEPRVLVKLNLFNWLTACLGCWALAIFLGAEGIGMGISVSTTLTCILGLVYLARRLPDLRMIELLDSLLKALGGGAVMIGFWWLTRLTATDMANNLGPSRLTFSLFQIVWVGLSGSMLYVGAAFLLRIEEARIIAQFVGQWFMRLRGVIR